MTSLLDQQDASEVLAQFPAVEFAVAYGSGAIAQGGYDYSDSKSKGSSSSSGSLPMIDFIFAVKDSEEFHLQNLAMNAGHYSSIIPFSALGMSNQRSAKIISYLNDSRSFGAGYWYNPMVTIPLSKFAGGRSVKYGVVRYDRLLEDMVGWTDLYGAGRLHKPVSIIKGSLDAELAMTTNRQHAVNVALLLLPDKFTDLELFSEIAAISYKGDARLLVGGENPKKIQNLVAPNLSSYRLIYSDIVKKMMSTEQSFNIREVGTSSNGLVSYEKNISYKTPHDVLSALPENVRAVMGIAKDPGIAIAAVNSPLQIKKAVNSAIGSIVRRSSLAQSVKGGVSAGLSKMSYYIFQKYHKRFLSYL